MKIREKITGLIYLILEKLFPIFLKKTQLRVITLHHLNEVNFKELKNLIIKLKKKKWKFISPNKFFHLIENISEIEGKNILITFDDGYLSQYNFAQNVLSKYDIKSIFFVTNDFIFNNDDENFVKKNLFPNIKINNVEKYKSMNIDHLKKLRENDHLIGAHTKTHSNLAKINDQSKLEKEILEAADELEIKLGFKIKNFAYTFGNFESINKEVIELASSRFEYIFSGMRGNNLFSTRIIARDAINIFSEKNINLAILNGFYDKIYSKKISEVKKWI